MYINNNKSSIDKKCIRIWLKKCHVAAVHYIENHSAFLSKCFVSMNKNESKALLTRNIAILCSTQKWKYNCVWHWSNSGDFCEYVNTEQLLCFILYGILNTSRAMGSWNFDNKVQQLKYFHYTKQSNKQKTNVFWNVQLYVI
jgi:hypothetical protein